MTLFYTLPDNARITMRNIDGPLRRLVLRVNNRWQGDRVSAVLSTTVHVEGAVNHMGSNTVKAGVLNLVTGKETTPTAVVERDDARVTWSGYAGQLDLGDALVIFKQTRSQIIGVARDADVTFYLRAFSSDNQVLAALDTARDAMLENCDQEATHIARELLPISHGLFLGLCRRERSQLRAREKLDAL